MTAPIEDLVFSARLLRLAEIADALVAVVVEADRPLSVREAIRLAGDRAGESTNDVKYGLGYAGSRGLIQVKDGIAVLGVAAEHLPTTLGALHRTMVEQWHAASDHGRDGADFGSFTCNCDRIVDRAISLGWTPPPPATRVLAAADPA
jgi:hypothetical protein